ncbi:MAG TPA: hypothetical protein VJT67_05180, partial [Longimicrobiaceae bacterium]|nr:hypothetical protein [Longimicrobiaceae bacterium]
SVVVRAGTVECAGATGGARGDLLVGGQGVNVRLSSTNVWWSSYDQVLYADVRVQNLLDQPLGTDGTTVSGIRVFFAQGPSVTAGSGTVTVLADSVGTFTAAGQPYYIYPGALVPRATSDRRTWRFSVPASVERFEFAVYVAAAVPAEGGVLHWRVENGVQPRGLHAVAAPSRTDVWVAGDGVVLHYDGNEWSTMRPCGGCNTPFRGIWAGGGEAFTVGDGGAMFHWTGSAWEDVRNPAIPAHGLRAIAGLSPTDLWAVGDVTILHWDGRSWSVAGELPRCPPVDGWCAVGDLTTVWERTPNEVWVAGTAGTVASWDGTRWQMYDANPYWADWNAVFRTDPTHVVLAGSVKPKGPAGPEGWVTYLPGPEVRVGGPPVVSGWMAAPGNVWLVTDASLLNWREGRWNAFALDSSFHAVAISGSDPDDAWAVGANGAIAHYTADPEGQGQWTRVVTAAPGRDVFHIWDSSAWGGVAALTGNHFLRRAEDGTWTEFGGIAATVEGGWTVEDDLIWADDTGQVADLATHFSDGLAQGAYFPVHAVWGSSMADVWIAGDGGRTKHWNGSGWTHGSTGNAAAVRALWGSGAVNVFAVGDGGTIERWNGTAWAAMQSGTDRELLAVWGSGPNDVWAVGAGGTVLHYDGSPAGHWTAVSSPAGAAKPVVAVWGTGPSDVYALADGGTSVLRWNGSSWRRITDFGAGSVPLRTIWGTGPRDLYLGGEGGLILHGHR